MSDSESTPGLNSGERLLPLLVGKIGERLAGLPLQESRGVSIPGRVTPIPGSPATLAGLLYFRGGIEAVIDLARVWGDPSPRRTPRSRAVLIEAEGMRGVIIFDELWDLAECSRDVLREPEIGLAGISSIAGWKGETLSILSASDLLRYVEAFVSLNSHSR